MQAKIAMLEIMVTLPGRGMLEIMVTLPGRGMLEIMR